ncbi:MAG: hypothetical protein QOH81_1104 [Sphingomonadales bacterium]|jgi:hypothetical protein|nr:hypothetical protein [Sphingomonadales bacterium]
MPSNGPNNGTERKFRDPGGEERQTVCRPCLRCERPFDSTGPGNRLCDGCRQKSWDLSPYAP